MTYIIRWSTHAWWGSHARGWGSTHSWRWSTHSWWGSSHARWATHAGRWHRGRARRAIVRVKRRPTVWVSWGRTPHSRGWSAHAWRGSSHSGWRSPESRRWSARSMEVGRGPTVVTVMWKGEVSKERQSELSYGADTQINSTV